MQLKYTLLLATGLLAGSAIAYTASQPDRRTVLQQSVTSAAMAFFLPGSARAADPSDGAGAADADGFISTESGLRYKVITEGTGAIPQTGQTVKAHYTGMDLLLLPLNHDQSDQNAALFLVRLVGWF